MRSWTVAALLLAASAGADELPAGYVEARTRLVAELAELATWCGKKQVYLDRARTCELILLFEPDHRAARLHLKYTLREGKWVRPTYTEPRNLAKAPHGEYEARCAAVVRTFTDAAIGELARGELPHDVRGRILDEILNADPDHEAARTMAGFVREGPLWVTAEVHRLHERRKQIKEAARNALSALPGVDARRSWVENRFWQVAGQLEHAELRRCADVATAMSRFVEACFGTPTENVKQNKIYVADNGKLFDALMRGLTTGDGYELAMRAGGAALPEARNITVYGPDVDTAVEQVARHTAALLLERDLHITRDVGWAREGVSLYLTIVLVRAPRYRNLMVSDTSKDLLLASRMADPDSDWRALARSVLRKGFAPSMPDLVTRRSAALESVDLLFSSMFAAYLLEAHEGKLRDLLCGDPERLRSLDGIAKVLGSHATDLEARFREWLARED